MITFPIKAGNTFTGGSFSFPFIEHINAPLERSQQIVYPGVFKIFLVFNSSLCKTGYFLLACLYSIPFYLMINNG